MPERDSQFLVEEWSLYALGAAIILTRFAVRLKTVRWNGFQGDDYMAVLVLAFFTMDAATVHIIYYTGTNVEASAIQMTRKLTDSEISIYEYGSKEQLAAWYSYTALIWCMKGQMLFFFHRLTMGLWQQRIVKWLGLGCGISYLAVVLTITFGCFPTYKNWQVAPDPGLQCTLKLQNFLVTVVLNVLTDAAILAIPVPLLWKLKVDLRRKLVIFLLLSSGLFVITAAIIRVVLTLGAHPSALNINRWGVRETIVGIITINIPILRPLFTRTFWTLHTYRSSSPSHGTTTVKRGYPGGTSYELSSRSGAHNLTKSRNASFATSDESLRGIIKVGEYDSCEFVIQNPAKGQGKKGVTVQTTYEVMSEQFDIEKMAGARSSAGSVAAEANASPSTLVGDGWKYSGGGVANRSLVHAPGAQTGHARGRTAD
ncbi:hypothetical protein BP5796_04171 [Coleophoma crateriformis]|uniref:Rhodopsin domain-containing protein n=1 Tax=Coleophoma crateriformis TaxID=565419 RepID=A0A3D8SHQ9_9HELO|nr:hypothetical protein BP5796_04171 [Coleophoma crateriformis]